MKKSTYSLVFMSIFLSFKTSASIVNESIQSDAQHWILSNGIEESNLEYSDADLWRKDENSIPSFDEIRKIVILKKNKYIVDFSKILDKKIKNKVKQKLSEQIGVSLPGDILVISPYKNSILLTPIESYHSPFMHEDNITTTMDGDYSNTYNSDDQESPTGYTFYVRSGQVYDKYCSFPKAPHKPNLGRRQMCFEPPLISLIYKFTFDRSFQFNDAANRKIVRVSIDEDSGGAGMKVTSKLDHEYIETARNWLGEYTGAFSLNASARDYAVSVSATSASPNSGLTLVSLKPRNANPLEEIDETNNISMGISGTTDPKKPITINASKSQSRTIKYKIHEYAYVLSTPKPLQADFKWTRSNNRTADSLLKFKSSAKFQYPADLGKLSPISHSNFIPFFDLAYEASPNYHGSASIMMDATMRIAPYYHSATNICGAIPGGFHCYRGYSEESTPSETISDIANLTVNFNHPAFSGTKPVILRLASLENSCITAFSTSVESNLCAKNNTAQAFIYDEKMRFESLNFRGLCLEDSNETLSLKSCTESLNQKWEWVPNSDKLKNIQSKNYISHSPNGKLAVKSEGDSDFPSVNTGTEFYDYDK
jgi:hemolysin